MPPLTESSTASTSAWIEDADSADGDWLVTAARSGRSDAWDEIFVRLHSDLLRFVRSRGVTDPDDVVQEVMAATVRQIGEIEGGWSGLRAWVFTVASRRCADFHRLRRSRPEILADSVPEPASAGSAADEPFWQESAFREASAALSILTERERDVVTLRVVDELDAAAVASALDLTPVNVRVIQSRALGKLRRHLDNNGGCLDKRFRLAPFPAVVEFLRRLRESVPWPFSGGRSPRLRSSSLPISAMPSSSPSVAEAASRSLSGISQSAAVLLLAAGVGASSFGLIPEPLSTPVVPFASGAVSAPPSEAPAGSPPETHAPERIPVPPPPTQNGLHGQVSTRNIHPSDAGAVVTELAAAPTIPTSPSAPDNAPSPSPTPASSTITTAVTDRTGEVISGVDEVVSTTADRIHEVASSTADVVDGAAATMSGVVDDVTDTLDDAAKTIGEASETVSDTTDVVEEAVGQATDATEDTLDDITDTAEDITEEVVDLISNPFGG